MRVSTTEFTVICGTFLRFLMEHGTRRVQTGLVGNRKALKRGWRNFTKIGLGITHLPCTSRFTKPDCFPLNLRRPRAVNLVSSLHIGPSSEILRTLPSLVNYGPLRKGFQAKAFYIPKRQFLYSRGDAMFCALSEQIVTSVIRLVFGKTEHSSEKIEAHQHRTVIPFSVLSCCFSMPLSLA